MKHQRQSSSSSSSSGDNNNARNESLGQHESVHQQQQQRQQQRVKSHKEKEWSTNRILFGKPGMAPIHPPRSVFRGTLFAGRARRELGGGCPLRLGWGICLDSPPRSLLRSQLLQKQLLGKHLVDTLSRPETQVANFGLCRANFHLIDTN